MFLSFWSGGVPFFWSGGVPCGTQMSSDGASLFFWSGGLSTLRYPGELRWCMSVSFCSGGVSCSSQEFRWCMSVFFLVCSLSCAMSTCQHVWCLCQFHLPACMVFVIWLKHSQVVVPVPSASMSISTAGNPCFHFD